MKLQAIWKIITNSNFVLITGRGYLASTPRFGHKEYWKNTREIFDGLEKNADIIQKNFTNPPTKGAK